MTDGPAVRVLGPVLLRGPGGGPVPPPGALPLRLVVALVLAGGGGRAVSGLAEDVWPEREPRSPRAALQMLVSRTRAVAADGIVLSTAAGYRVAESDLAVAERAGEAEAAAALALWRGEPGAELEPSPIADELTARAARARRRLLALEGGRLMEAGRFADAVSLLSERVDLDPLDGDAVRALMRALAAAGSTDLAIAAFARHREALADALGADPASETAALNADLLRVTAAGAATVVGVRAAANPLLGRDADVDRLVAAVAADRLTSVVGTGGLGKTRLAHEVATRVAGGFDRVVFVELAGAQTEEDVALVVGATVGARTAQARRLGDPLPADLATRTREALAGARTLLVLDNCEHVVEAAARLAADLLAAVPALSILTTSRVPLLLAGEHVVAPEPLPASGAGSDLFVARATAARPAAVLDPDLVARVCGRLDGLPLAIELAAARLRSMSLTELDRRLADRFAVLVGGDRSAPERHRTLLAVIDWSRRLLTPAARDALGLLAQFPDGFAPDGAAEVLGTDPTAVLTELVDQSLLAFQDGDGPDGRHRMLETVREFGLRDLAESGRLPAGRDALDRWAIAFCRGVAPGTLLGIDAGAARAVSAEEETLLAVLRRDPAGREAAVTAAFSTLAEHWAYRGDFEALLDALPIALASVGRRPANPDERAESVKALVLVSSVTLAIRHPGAARAVVLLRRALASGAPTRAFWEVLGRDLLLADTPAGLDAAVDRLTRAGDPLVRATALAIRSQLMENAGAAAAGIEVLREVDRLATRHGLRWLRVFGRLSAISLQSQLGEHRPALDAALALRSDLAEMDTPSNLQQLDWLIASDEVALGLLDPAEERFRALAAVTERASGPDARDTHAIALTGLAEVASARGGEEAEAAWTTALAAVRRASWPWRALGLGSSLAARSALGAPLDDLLPDYRRLRALLLALVRLDPARLDVPVFSGGLVGLGAALRSAGDPAGAQLIGLAAALGARRDLASLDAAVRGASADRGDDARGRAIALLRSPALRR